MNGINYNAYKIIIVFLLFSNVQPPCLGLLFPQQNELRVLDSLDGLWTFVREPPNSNDIGLTNGWAQLDLSTFENSTRLPVPAAFNDLSAGGDLREHVGWVWYQRECHVPAAILGQPGRRTFLRFGSVQYNAIVFVNGLEMARHVGGHLPFQFEVTNLNLNGQPNIITVAVNNTLSDETIPPGRTDVYNLSSGRQIVHQTPNFDFFNYAGILRPVHLWHLPQAHIAAIKIVANASGDFSYRIQVDYGPVPAESVLAKVTILNGKEKVAETWGLQNETQIANAQLWWPRGMGEANLYIAEVALINGEDGRLLDIYRETFGFRSVFIEGSQIHINGRPFYCHGFGMHEDFEVHGRGFDRAVMTKDLNMFEWLNANCYRTSHYPYSEERAYEADRRGIAVITEVPAVGIKVFTKPMQQLHGRMVTEMVLRDWNHPSVIMWSLANEPEMHNNGCNNSAYEYFKDLVVLAKQLDATRPVTMVFGHLSYKNVASILDVVCFNLYYGWYSDLGLLDLIHDHLAKELRSWQTDLPGKPLILSEYGAEAIAGMHNEPALPFTEQYQAEVIGQTAAVLDEFRGGDGQLTGEMLWNFADFMTSSSLQRVMGNHKGMLTRDRKPKMGAYVLRQRYKQLMEEAAERNADFYKIDL